jgi:hypothetical protein
MPNHTKNGNKKGNNKNGNKKGNNKKGNKNKTVAPPTNPIVEVLGALPNSK